MPKDSAKAETINNENDAATIVAGNAVPEEKTSLSNHLQGIHGWMDKTSRAAFDAGDHEAHAAIHACQVILGDLVQRVRGAEKHLEKHGAGVEKPEE